MHTCSLLRARHDRCSRNWQTLEESDVREQRQEAAGLEGPAGRPHATRPSGAPASELHQLSTYLPSAPGPQSDPSHHALRNVWTSMHLKNSGLNQRDKGQRHTLLLPRVKTDQGGLSRQSCRSTGTESDQAVKRLPVTKQGQLRKRRCVSWFALLCR